MKCLKKVFVDLDGTLAEWKESAKWEELLEPGYYYNLAPHRNLMEAIQLLWDQFDWHILSAYLTDTPYPMQDKQLWVQKYLPFMPAENVHLVPYGTLKAAIPAVTPGSVLLDDYTKNLTEWENFRESSMQLHAIKALNGVNGIPIRWTEFGIRKGLLYPGMAVDVLNTPPKELAKDLLQKINLLQMPMSA